MFLMWGRLMRHNGKPWWLYWDLPTINEIQNMSYQRHPLDEVTDGHFTKDGAQL